jgi:hypothetical protein
MAQVATALKPVGSQSYVNHKKRLTKDATWKPQGKAQAIALACTMVNEVLMEGNRGGGKTITLIMTYVSQVGRGWGANWRGVIFRQTHPALKDIIKQSKQWIPLIYPGAKFTHNDSTWTFPEGEQLTFSHFANPDDYKAWHGQELPFIGWEELTNWSNDECYSVMLSCNRSSAAPNPLTGEEMPRIVRSTTNPYGPGRLWVKERWELPDMRGKIRTGLVNDKGESLGDRLAIQFSLESNKIMLDNDPNYRAKVRAATQGNEAMEKAWLDGDWEISVGGMFDDLWDRKVHVVEPFDLPGGSTRGGGGWKLYRAFDYGFSKPYSIGLYAVSDGTPYHDRQGNLHTSINGDVYRVAEIYGWDGKPNHGCREEPGEIAQRLLDFEIAWGIHGLVQPGPADLNIFSREQGKAMHDEFVSRKVNFRKAAKEPGSRVRGWMLIRQKLLNALPRYLNPDGTIVSSKDRKKVHPDAKPLRREEPALFFFGEDRNKHLLRTMIGAPRDEKNPDDIDTDYEDHALDELRYYMTTKKIEIKQSNY